MSMKRAKQRGNGASRDKDTETDFWSKPPPAERSWEEEMADKPDNGFVPYALSDRYAKGQLILHTKFGKGVVVDADTTRVEILFQDGKKKLGHGQQV